MYSSLFILKCTFRCSSRCILRCPLNCIIRCTSNAFIVVPFALSCALPGALKSSLLLSFLIGQILHLFAPLSLVLKAFSSASYTRSPLQSFEELFVTLLCSSKKIIACTLKCTMIYTNVCIIYSAGIALYACIK